MPSLNSILIEIRGDASGLQATLSKAGSAIQGFASTTVKGSGQMVAGLGATEKATGGLFNSIKGNMGHLLAMGLGFAAFYRGLVLVNQGIDSVIGGFTNFDENMRNVQSLTKQTDVSLERLNTGILHLASSGESMGKSAVDLSAAMYDIASAGFVGQEALDILKISARGAAAGLSDTKTASAALISIIYAYKRPVSDAQNIMDSLFRIVDLGIINFQQLTSTLGLVIPAAAAMRVSLDELGAGIVLLTRQGQQPSRVMTNLNAVLTALLKPTKQAQETAKRLGIDFSAAAVQSKGFPAVLADISAKAGDSDTDLARMFGNVRAIRAIFPLAANGGQEYIAMLDAMGIAHEGAGASARALAEQQKSFMFQLRVAGTALQAYLITGMRPVVIWMAQNLPRATAVAGKAFSVLTYSIGGVFSVLKDLQTGTGGLLVPFIAINAAVFGLVKTFGALVPVLFTTAAATAAQVGALAAEQIVALQTAYTVGALTAAELALAEAEVAATATTAALNASFLTTAGWIGLAIAAIAALGFAYHWLKGRQQEVKLVSDETATAWQEAFAAAEAGGSSLASLGQAEEDTAQDTADLGEAISKQLIAPLEEFKGLSDEARYSLEKLTPKIQGLAQVAANLGAAEGAIKALYGSLSSMDEAINAENLATLRGTLAAVGGSPALYDEASASVDALSASEKTLTDQVDDARRSFGTLDDQMKAQERTLEQDKDAAKKLSDAFNEVKQRIQELTQAALPGEAKYRQAFHDIEAQTQALQYRLTQLGTVPAYEEERKNIRRQIADLANERQRLELEQAQTVGEQRFNLEELAKTINTAQPYTALSQQLEGAVDDYKQLKEPMDAANAAVDAQQTLVDDLKPAWQAAKDNLDNLTSALGVITTALGDFQKALESAAQFSVDQFNRMQEAAAAAGGAAQDALNPEAVAAPLMPGIAAFAQKLAADTKTRLEHGAEGMPEDFSDVIQRNVTAGFLQAKVQIGKDKSPEELAQIVSKETLDALEQQFGTDWPKYRDVITAEVNKAIIGSSGSPVLGASITDAAAGFVDTYAKAIAMKLDEEAPDSWAALQNSFTRLIEQLPGGLRGKLRFVSGMLAADLIPDKDTLDKALTASGVSGELSKKLAQEMWGHKDDLEANLLLASEAVASVLAGQTMFEWLKLHPGMNIAYVLGQDIIANGGLFKDQGVLIATLVANGMDEESARRYVLWVGRWKTTLEANPLTRWMAAAIPASFAPPGKQHGARDFGGWAMMGEAGRELAFMPPHTAIASAKDTAQIMDFFKNIASGKGGQGAVFSPQFSINAIGDRWEELKMRIMSMVSQYLDQAGAQAGIASPLVVQGVGVPRI